MTATTGGGGTPTEQLSAKGHLDRLDAGLVTGWFASSDNTPLTEPVTVWVGEQAVAQIDHCDYREDLAQAGIADGHAAFSVDVSASLDDSDEPVEIALSTGPRDAPQVFLRQTVARIGHAPLNANPFMRPEDDRNIEGWSIEHDAALGLHVDDFPLPRELHRFAARYTRLALTGEHADGHRLRLACPLTIDREPGADLSVMLLVRADRDTQVSCAVSAGGRAGGGCELEASTAWSLRSFPLAGSSKLATAAGKPVEFALSIAHRGRGFLDIALCYVACAPSVRYLDRMNGAFTGDASLAAPVPGRASFVRNGDFEAWSHGIRFASLRSGQTLADNWSVEGSKALMQRVSVSMDSAVRRSALDDVEPLPRFGLRVSTSEFDGAVRLLSEINRAALDETALTLSLSLHALGRSRVARLRRVQLLVRGSGHESSVSTLASKVRVRAHSQLDIAIDERSVIDLRRACVDDRRLLLSLEIEGATDVFIESVDVFAGHAAAVAPEPAAELARDTGFEDSNVQQQLTLLKGLEGWQGGADCRDAALVPAAAALLQGTEPLTNLVAADIRRPYAGYPSVDIIVPVYNALESVKDCVRSVIEHTTVPYTLILLDDGSQPDTHAWLEHAARRFPNVVLVTNEQNRGYTRTVNRGLRLSNADHVCVLNSDCIVTPEWLPLMIDCASQQERAGMVGPLSNAASYQSVPRIRDESGAWCFNPLPDIESPASMAARVRENSTAGWPKVRVLNGFCQLISRQAIESIGFLDEEAFPRGFGEENDYCARLIEAGFTLHVVDDAYVFHTKSQSFGHEQRKSLSKEGSAALKRKHPTLDWGEITREVEFATPMAELRDRLAA